MPLVFVAVFLCCVALDTSVVMAIGILTGKNDHPARRRWRRS